MATHLFFVRHAHSVYTPDELGRPLSLEGKADAEKITSILGSENIDVVIPSPYQRAIQTVKGVADLIGKEVQIEEDFRERLLSNGPVADFKASITKVWEDPAFSLRGGETNNAAQDRGVLATLKVLNQFDGRNIVIGTHGNLMALIMNHFDPCFGFAFWEELDMPDIYKLTFTDNELSAVNRIWHRN